MLHLQPMLKRAQEDISLGQFRALLFRNEIAVGQPSQTYQRVRHAQPFVATSVGQLQRLRDELNFPNSASLKFHVEAVISAFDVSIDLLLGQPNTGERIFDRNIGPVDIVFTRSGKPRKKRAGTGRGAAANQSLKFPGLRGFAVVLQRLIKRTSERAVAAVWPQTQIDAIRRAFACRLAHQFADGLGELDEVFAVAQLASLTRARSCRRRRNR